MPSCPSSKTAGGSVAEIVAKLSKKFPDRDADGLTATVRTQMSRLKLSRKMKIKATGHNPVKYSIQNPSHRRSSRGPRGPRFRYSLVLFWSSPARIALERDPPAGAPSLEVEGELVPAPSLCVLRAISR
jgi:hypothetical protein